MNISDRGPWYVDTAENDGRVFVCSEDFTHDVCLYVNGDFSSREERLAYAEEIARRLNTFNAERNSDA